MSPRDIVETQNNFRTITKYDKLWVKYYNNPDAHSKAKEYFLNHKEYTHVSRIPDDLIITQEGIDKLVSDLQKNQNIECISGVGNVHGRDTENYGICMDELPAKAKKDRKYVWLPIKNAPTSGIYRVRFGGGYATFFSRRLMENVISWQTDLVAEATKYDNKTPYKNEISCCNDLVISHELNDAGIPEYVDFAVVTRHLKYLPGTRDMKIGREKPYLLLEPKK